MVMITGGCEKKPQGVVSVTRGEFSVPEVTDVTRFVCSRATEMPQPRPQAGFKRQILQRYQSRRDAGLATR
jgi:hypothetical protein